MKLRSLFCVKKSRKYPIKRDEEGLSSRARCFALFEQGKRPAAVAEELKMKETTVCRYFRDWKRLGRNFETRYAYVQSLFKKTTPDREKNVELFALACGISKERFEAVLSQPHGLRRLMTGKFYFPAHATADHKQSVALELALLISNYLTKNGGKFEDVYFALERYMQEDMKYRQQEDADIEEHNLRMEFIHKVLAKDMEIERRRRVKPDTLSQAERDIVIRLGVEREIKKVEIAYWLRIGSLKAEGLTPEQAREKIYQDLLEKGDLQGAKALRAYQDIVHPLKAGDQSPLSKTPQLSSDPSKTPPTTVSNPQ